MTSARRWNAGRGEQRPRRRWRCAARSYWPAEAADAHPVGVIEAARADPRLGERDRRVLTAVYRELVRKQAKDDDI